MYLTKVEMPFAPPGSYEGTLKRIENHSSYIEFVFEIITNHKKPRLVTLSKSFSKEYLFPIYEVMEALGVSSGANIEIRADELIGKKAALEIVGQKPFSRIKRITKIV